jgi:L-lactate dehydrogenase complex protein LldG
LEPIAREYRRDGMGDTNRLVDLFASRIEHYDGRVLRCGAGGIATAVADALHARGKRQMLVPDGLPADWLPAGFEFVVDRRLPNEDLDRSEGVMTGCSAAIALTGTMLLCHGPGEGRRALTLVPDYHLSVVFADQIVETVPEGLRRVAARSTSLVTLISGPSATADIEMTRIKGVHGPRTLDVVIVGTQTEAPGPNA